MREGTPITATHSSAEKSEPSEPPRCHAHSAFCPGFVAVDRREQPTARIRYKSINDPPPRHRSRNINPRPTIGLAQIHAPPGRRLLCEIGKPRPAHIAHSLHAAPAIDPPPRHRPVPRLNRGIVRAMTMRVGRGHDFSQGKTSSGQNDIVSPCTGDMPPLPIPPSFC